MASFNIPPGIFMGGFAQGMQAAQQQGLRERAQQAQEDQWKTQQINARISETAKFLQNAGAKMVAAGIEPDKVVEALTQQIAGVEKLAGHSLPYLHSMVSTIANTPAPGQPPKVTRGQTGQPIVVYPNMAHPDQTRFVSQPGAIPQGAPSPTPAQPGANATVAERFNAVEPQLPQWLLETPLPPGYTPKLIDFMATQWIGGNDKVFSGLGRRKDSNVVRAVVRRRGMEIAKARGMTASDVNAAIATYGGQKRAAGVLGQRMGQIIGAIEGAKNTAGRVLETSKLVVRTNYMPINQLLEIARTKMGDPHIVQFSIAVNTFINNYARAVGAGSTVLSDSARHEAMQNLDTAWSQGQIEAAIMQMQKELASEELAARSAFRHLNKAFKSAYGNMSEEDILKSARHALANGARPIDVSRRTLSLGVNPGLI